MKKQPMKDYHKKTGRHPFIGQMASDSRQRKINYYKHGCNAFSGTIQSNPLGFWLEEDVWTYLKDKPYSKIYDMGHKRTGCTFCMFGVHMEKEPNRFQLMKETHPKLYDYCINKLGCGKVLDYIGVKYENTILS